MFSAREFPMTDFHCIRRVPRYFFLCAVLWRIREEEMNRRIRICLSMPLLAFSAYSLSAAPASPSQPPRALTCYVVMEEGGSAEGNSLFLKKMGVDPEAVKTFAPTRFSRVGGKFTAFAQGVFSYQAETPVLVDRSGRLALYEFPLRLKSDAPPNPEKTVTVTVLLSELAKSGGIVQPALKAMDKAAASLKWTEGTAWIIDMRRAGKGKLKAIVGLTK